MRLLENQNAILRWFSTQILGNLAAVDREDKLEPVLDRFFAPILGKKMIGAANAIAAAGNIALAKPHFAERMVREILKVERACYRTAECRNVAIGHAIKSFKDRFSGHVKNQRPVLAFVTRQLETRGPPRARRQRSS